MSRGGKSEALIRSLVSSKSRPSDFAVLRLRTRLPATYLTPSQPPWCSSLSKRRKRGPPNSARTGRNPNNHRPKLNRRHPVARLHAGAGGDGHLQVGRAATTSSSTTSQLAMPVRLKTEKVVAPLTIGNEPAVIRASVLCPTRNRLRVPFCGANIRTPHQRPAVRISATPGLRRCSFYTQRILSPVGRWAYYRRPFHEVGRCPPQTLSIEVAERSLSGVGEKRLRPAARPIQSVGTSMKQQIA
jgi:hypothetical protein